MAPVHPLILAMVAVGLLGALLGIHQYAPTAILWIFVAAVFGMIIRVWLLAREDEALAEGTTGLVDHTALRAKDFSLYGDWLKENVRGHDAAVTVVTRTINRGLQLSQPGRSLGSFLLVGPTGTGKTFLSLMASKALWPDREPVVLRMNQCKDPSDVRLLLGEAGSTVGGLLTQPVLEDPHRVVVLDEIDKCHPEVLHCLFDALDGGRCRDKTSGRIVDFSGCVFFATCNAGTESLRSLKGLEPDAYVAKARDVLAREAGFDKSFLARFSEILLLDTLPVVNIAEIACLLLTKQWREQGMEISYVSPEFLAQLIRTNSEFAHYGVRQLAHCMRRMTDPLLEEARRRGQLEVALGVGPAGEAALIEEPPRGLRASL
jgi:ATP-dependent Clp protease ATP-binding subunit ClpA